MDEADAAEQEGKPKDPLFRSHGAIVVALPEVRVEESRAKLDEWLLTHGGEVTVVSRDDGRRPARGWTRWRSRTS